MSYVSDRSIKIADGIATEDGFHSVQVGIPQGSPLSPFLFNAYSVPLFTKYLTFPEVSYVEGFALMTRPHSYEENARDLTM